jgi:hypothetical protein
MQIKRKSRAVWDGTGKERAAIPEISEDKFSELVQDARVNYPVSKLLNCEISFNAKLN